MLPRHHHPHFVRILSAVLVAVPLCLSGAVAALAHSDQDMDGMAGMDHPAGFSFGTPGKAAEATRTVTVVMKEMSFEPAAVTVKPGETIRFVVRNESDVDHDFTLGDTVTQTAHRREMAEMMEKGGEMHHHDDANAVMVKAGTRAELVWKFTRPGSLEYDCNIPGHYEAGMKGTIRVAP